jgi:ribosomal protein L11 methyltransferase
MRYLRCTYAAPADVHELLVSALWEAGTLGVEERGEDLVAWFAAEGASVALPAGAALRAEAWVEGADWLAGYRAQAQPLAVGERLWLDPREPDAPPLPAPPGRLTLQVPARTAFGTGSHASTRLALRLLETMPLAGATVLDVGAGSGVLAMAALALGARRATGLDVDPAAALLAGQHARLNDLPAVFWAGSLAALRGGVAFAVVVVNALPHEVLPEAAALVAAVATGGRLLVSGVPVAEEDAVLAVWVDHALAPVERLAEEEWVAWRLERR